MIWIWSWYLNWLQNANTLKLGCPFFSHFIEWNWRPLSLKCWHFEASEDIMTKFKSEGLHIIKIKYWKVSGSGNPPFLIPALWKIAFLCLKTGLWQWYTGISVRVGKEDDNRDAHTIRFNYCTATQYPQPQTYGRSLNRLKVFFCLWQHNFSVLMTCSAWGT